jgi:hypothetical protein
MPLVLNFHRWLTFSERVELGQHFGQGRRRCDGVRW